MTPGLARGPPFPSKAVKDSVVAIASIENPSVPRVVGFCEIDVASLGEVHGVKGHAVKGFHWEGDEIWSWGQGGKSGEIGPKEIEGWDINGENEKLRKEIDSLSLNDSEDGADNGGVPTDSVAKNEDLEASRNEFVEGESLAPVGETKAESKTLSTKGEINLAIQRLRC